MLLVLTCHAVHPLPGSPRNARDIGAKRQQPLFKRLANAAMPHNKHLLALPSSAALQQCPGACW